MIDGEEEHTFSEKQFAQVLEYFNRELE